MLYFAYGSNLNHHRMKFRCKGAKHLNNYALNGYKLCFSHKTDHSVFGHANIIKSKKSKIKGAIWKITKAHEKELDVYEGVNYGYYKNENNNDYNSIHLNKKEMIPDDVNHASRVFIDDHYVRLNHLDKLDDNFSFLKKNI